MTAKKKPKPKAVALVKTGRPTAYRSEYDAQAAKLCALGATDADLAGFFGVTETTVNNWKLAHQTFLESLRRSKDDLDAKVEHSLARRALGWKQKAVKITVHAESGHTTVTPYVERFPGDTTAMIFWLKNRQPERWRDRSTVEHDVTGKLAAHMRAAEDRLSGRATPDTEG